MKMIMIRYVYSYFQSVPNIEHCNQNNVEFENIPWISVGNALDWNKSWFIPLSKRQQIFVYMYKRGCTLCLGIVDSLDQCRLAFDVKV